MYQFKLANGDIQMEYDGSIDKVTGADRIAQDLACWLLEPMGTDAVYRRFGSTLWSKIGEPIVGDKLAEIRSEVKRVVDNYIAYNQSQFKAASKYSADYFARSWGNDVMITELVGIDVSTVADTVNVVVKLATTGGTVTVNQTL